METSDTNSLTGGSTPPPPPPDHTSAQTSNNPPGNHTANNEDEKATTKEVVLKDTYDELEKYFGKGKVEIERTSYDDINMIFEHESYHWMLRFAPVMLIYFCLSRKGACFHARFMKASAKKSSPSRLPQ